ncbi:ABC transporter substrate-binding protein [Metabacillus fastidiosus]|uniref:ABC transporter substrate-binding protein n=1 Tax=Metabacillus fastidiosus TaxID=1458 RepID=A0ABU6P3T6_9BACI|nr:ABC transporter substrate-binding protein [Metabacillus fastidiosus]MED4403951.1 ABC transporter substrate-binding protein [Metabacillus fastidiosus]MED4461123.1 ABC transporter substrate-binding protein [Metabacillus fastidiosus]
MKRLYGLIVFSLVLSLFLAGCSNDSKASTEGEKTAKVRIGIDTAAGGSLQIRAANTEGYFEKHGIEPQLSNFAYGIDTINALLTEQTDTGLAADYALLNSLNRGDLVVISSLSHSTSETIKKSEILAVKDINEPAQLKGKKIGVAKGTVSEYHWAKYLEHLGIKEEEVHYVPFSTPDEAIIGVKKGDIDAVLANGAVIEKYKAIDGVHKIDDLSSIDISLSAYLVANRKFAEENPKAVVNVLKAIKEGMAYVKENPDGTAEIAYKELKVKKEDTLRDLERSNYTLEFKQEDFDHLSTMKEWLLDKNLLKKDYDLQDKLVLEPLREAFPESVTYGN